MVDNTDQIRKMAKINDFMDDLGLSMSISNDYFMFSENGRMLSIGFCSIDEAWGWINCYKDFKQGFLK